MYVCVCVVCVCVCVWLNVNHTHKMVLRIGRLERIPANVGFVCTFVRNISS